MKKPKFLPPVEVTITYCFKDSRKRDFDNFMPKFIFDGLKETFLDGDDANTWIKTLNLRMLFSQPETKTIVDMVSIDN
jgi:Holliday junction resolvase RusA-like endonuclease